MKFEKLSANFKDLSRAKMIVARICMHGCQTTQGYVFRTGLGHIKSQQIPQKINRTYCIQQSFQPSHFTKAMVFHLWTMDEYNRPSNYTHAFNVHDVRHLLACMVNTPSDTNQKHPNTEKTHLTNFGIIWFPTPIPVGPLARLPARSTRPYETQMGTKLIQRVGCFMYYAPWG